MGQNKPSLISTEEKTEVEKVLSELLESIGRLDKAALALGETCE